MTGHPQHALTSCEHLHTCRLRGSTPPNTPTPPSHIQGVAGSALLRRAHPPTHCHGHPAPRPGHQQRQTHLPGITPGSPALLILTPHSSLITLTYSPQQQHSAGVERVAGDALAVCCLLCTGQPVPSPTHALQVGGELGQTHL